jgi:DNA-binding IclR family transcriptional regulator
MKNNKKYSFLNQSITRALDILDAFSREKEEWTPTEMSTRVGLNISTAHRMMQTLEYRGMLEQNPVNGKYRIGIKAYQIGNRYLVHNMLERQSLPVLDVLSYTLGLDVNLSYLDSLTAEIVIILSQQGKRVIQTSSPQPGMRGPAQITAAGKTIMAFLENDNQVKLESMLTLIKFRPYTKNSIVSLSALKKEFIEIRQRGYAVDDRESGEHVRSVSAPVFNHQGRVVSAVSVSGYVEEITLEKVPEVAREAMAAAATISKKMGAQR